MKTETVICYLPSFLLFAQHSKTFDAAIGNEIGMRSVELLPTFDINIPGKARKDTSRLYDLGGVCLLLHTHSFEHDSRPVFRVYLRRTGDVAARNPGYALRISESIRGGPFPELLKTVTPSGYKIPVIQVFFNNVVYHCEKNGRVSPRLQLQPKIGLFRD